MSDIESGVLIIPTGRPCWGCINLLTERVPMVGEDFYCTGILSRNRKPVLIGRVRKIMDGCIVPREIEEGCHSGR
jgi:hypothetical protein